MKRLIALIAAFVAVGPAPGWAREEIRIVGSSTVFPFSAAVAERFGRQTAFPTPVVESTGTGGGFKLFCRGVGPEHPDIADASRAIKSSEVDACARNAVGEVIELPIGFDGIVIASSKRVAPMALSRKQIFLALAREIPRDGALVPNPHQKWSDIDPALPDRRIEVLGPPPTSGTRDAFVELAMEGGARTIPMLGALRKSDKKRFQAIAHAIREDGAFIEAGENDNLIVQKLIANPGALGVFGFSFLDQNADRIRGARVDGVEPSFENIASSSYPVSRTLFIYMKADRLALQPGLAEFIEHYLSERATGDEGYLADKGLIPLPAAQRAELRRTTARVAQNR